MSNVIHSFDEAGYYTGSAERPIDPVRDEPAAINEMVATLDPLPAFDPQTQRVRHVEGAWTVETIPKPVLPEPEPIPLAWPIYVGNAKLDLFTPEEQLAVVTATMTDPVVKLMYDRLLGAAYLTYEDPETERGLAVLVDKELITPERKAEIVIAMQPR